MLLVGAASILDQILRANLGLHGPALGAPNLPSSPLYLLRVSDAELESLRAALAVELRSSDTQSASECAAFCLWAAVRFRRAYQGGPWTWRLVLEPLAYSPPARRLYEVVRKGLSFLGRGILSGPLGTEYLFTLACEGGLPLWLLRSEGAHVRRFFRDLLRERETYPHTSSIELAWRASASVLPESLRNEILVGLSAALVDEIAQLRRRAPPSASPELWLDRYDPGWRSRLPIETDDELANELVRGLLEARAPTPARIGIDSFLSLDPPRLHRKLTLPGMLRADEVSKRFGLGPNLELPSRIELRLVRGAESHKRGALLYRQYQGDSYEVEVDHDSETTFDGELRLGFGDRSIELPGGESLGTGPWTFACSDPHHLPLRATGEARLMAEKLVVAVPASGSLEVLEGTAEPIGKLTAEARTGRALFALSGRARVSWDELEQDRSVLIESGAPSDEATSYYLRGARLANPFEDDLWLGTPTVFRVGVDGLAKAVSGRELEWRGAGGSWTATPGLGLGRVRVRTEREEVFSSPVRVLPGDFSLQAQPLARGGHVTLSSARLTDVGVAGPSAVEVRRDGGKFVVELSPSETARTLSLHLRFGAIELPIKILSPLTFTAFLRGAESMSASDLEGLASVRAVGGHAHGRGGYLVEGRLEAQGERPGKWAILGRLSSVDPTRDELGLDALRGLVAAQLSSSDQLDARVRLKISGGSGRPPVLLVQRHHAELAVEREPTQRSVSLPETWDAAESLQAFPIWRMSEPAPLRRLSERTWVLEYSACRPGPYLVVGPRGIRPLRVTVPGPIEEEESLLHAAIRTGDPIRRAELMEAAVAALERNPLDPDWSVVDGQLARLGIVPANAFDLLRRIVQRPTTAALALLRAPARHFVAIWEGLEELPMLWSTLPCEAFRRAFESLSKSTQETFGSSGSEILRGMISGFVACAPRQALYMGAILEWLSEARPELGLDLRGSPWVARARKEPAALLQIVAELSRSLPEYSPGTSDILEGAKSLGIELPGVAEDRRWLSLAPAVSAAAALGRVKVTEPLQFELRRARSIRPDEFELAHTIHLALGLSS